MKQNLQLTLIRELVFYPHNKFWIDELKRLIKLAGAGK